MNRSSSTDHDGTVNLFVGRREVMIVAPEWRLTVDDFLRWKLERRKAPNRWMSLTGSPGSARLPFAVIRVDRRWLWEFRLLPAACRLERVDSPWGPAMHVKLSAELRRRTGLVIRENITLNFYERWRDGFGCYLEFEIDPGCRAVQVESVHYNLLQVDARRVGAGRHSADFWSFHGSSLSWGRDEILPLRPGFYQENFLGLQDASRGPRSPRYHYRHKQRSVDKAYRFFGGGIPVVDLWSRRGGLLLGITEPHPVEVSLPIRVSRSAETLIGIERKIGKRIEAACVLSLPRGVLFHHCGDFYEGLRAYAEFMRPLNFNPPLPAPEARSPSWCGYGYSFDFTQREMLAVVPKLQEYRISWLAVDERWFDRYGDWQPRRDTFPGGVEEFKRFVESFHERGFRVQIWWVPLLVETGGSGYRSHRAGLSEVARAHPEWLLVDARGKPALGPRRLNLFCPAVPAVQDYFAEIAERFLAEWNLDGHKLDAVYTVPPCFNPKHRHTDPEESVHAFPQVFRRIWETSRRIKPDGLIMICPCGTTPNFHLLSWMNQPVTADPITSEQLRWRTKYLKALLGDRVPVYGDHVELVKMIYSRRECRYQEVGTDFASAVGTGAVPGTRFVWPSLTRKQIRSEYLLDRSKAADWQKWFDLYRRYPLTEGEYRNLYTIGYDWPECHVLARASNLYYAFYAGSSEKAWSGRLELRGVPQGEFKVCDYERDVLVGRVRGPNPRLRARIPGHLLLEVSPEEPTGRIWF